MVGLALAFAAVGGCTAARAKGEGTLRVVTWNVMRGLMVDVEHSALVRHLVPARATFPGVLVGNPGLAGFDVLALQELCGDEGGKQLRYFEQLVGGLGQRWSVFARNDEDRVGACAEGVAILSRLPILASGTMQLPTVRLPERTAIWADLRLPSGQGARLVRVYNVHLHHSATNETGPQGRAWQLAAVLAHAAAWQRSHPQAATLLVGDFNTMEAVEPALVAAAAQFRSALPPGRSTHWLGWRLDHIYVHRLRLLSSHAVRTGASDHLAVAADFDLAADVNAD